MQAIFLCITDVKLEICINQKRHRLQHWYENMWLNFSNVMASNLLLITQKSHEKYSVFPLLVKKYIHSTAINIDTNDGITKSSDENSKTQMRHSFDCVRFIFVASNAIHLFSLGSFCAHTEDANTNIVIIIKYQNTVNVLRGGNKQHNSGLFNVRIIFRFVIWWGLCIDNFSSFAKWAELLWFYCDCYHWPHTPTKTFLRKNVPHARASNRPTSLRSEKETIFHGNKFACYKSLLSLLGSVNWKVNGFSIFNGKLNKTFWYLTQSNPSKA